MKQAGERLCGHYNGGPGELVPTQALREHTPPPRHFPALLPHRDQRGCTVTVSARCGDAVVEWSLHNRQKITSAPFARYRCACPTPTATCLRRPIVAPATRSCGRRRGRGSCLLPPFLPVLSIRTIRHENARTCMNLISLPLISVDSDMVRRFF